MKYYLSKKFNNNSMTMYMSILVYPVQKEKNDQKKKKSDKGSEATKECGLKEMHGCHASACAPIGFSIFHCNRRLPSWHQILGCT